MRRALWLTMGGFLAYRLARFLMQKHRERQLQLEALEFVSKAHPTIPAIPTISKDKETLILTRSASELAALIREGKIKSLEAVSVYIKRAAVEGRRLHLSAQESFEDALFQAAACDEQLQTDPKACGRLHGVPICVKDVLCEKGKPATCGAARLTKEIETEDAVLVQMLKAEGAIILLRGSVPQTVDWVETDNHLFGKGGNPWDASRTSGGSTEPALVVSQCVPLAISTDSSDSLQLSCAFSGAYGFRPTPDRVSRIGLKHSHVTGISPYEWLRTTTIGPVGRSTEDLALVLQIWWTEKMYQQDISLPELPFNAQIYAETAGGKKVKIGVFSDNGLMEPVQGAVSRLKRTVELLKEQGYEVVEFPLPQVQTLFSNVLAAVFSYMGKAIDDSLQGEACIDAFVGVPLIYAMRKCTFLLKVLLGYLKEKRTAEMMSVPLLSTSAEAINVYYLVRDWRIAFVKEWQKAGIDVLLCPSWPLPAPRHGEIANVMMAQSYCSLWNLMGFPVGVLPTGPLVKSELEYRSSVEDSVTKGSRKVCSGAEGLPLSLSIVGLPYTDERVLGLMKVLESLGLGTFRPTLGQI